MDQFDAGARVASTTAIFSASRTGSVRRSLASCQPTIILLCAAAAPAEYVENDARRLADRSTQKRDPVT